MRRGEGASSSLSQAPPESHYRGSKHCRVGQALVHRPETHTLRVV